jgi:hypothetical protein
MVNLIPCEDVRSQEGLKIAALVRSRNESRTTAPNGFAQKVEYHLRQWVDGSDLFYFEGSSGRLCKSHPRQWADGSDPLYCGLATQMLAQDNFVAPIRNDLNNPPTSVGGIHEAALLLAVDRI